MAGLLTVEQLRCAFPFEIHQDVDKERLLLPIVSAIRRLRVWVGNTLVDAAIAEASEVDETKLILQHAAGYLAMHYAMIGLNTQMRNFGLVKSEQVEGDTVNTYFNPVDVANFTTQYLEMAREIAEPYAIGDGTPSSSFEVADCL